MSVIKDFEIVDAPSTCKKQKRQSRCQHPQDIEKIRGRGVEQVVVAQGELIKQSADPFC